MSQNPDRVWTVLSMLEWATDFFEKKKVDNPRLSIEWLLAHVLGIKRLDLYLQYDRPLSSEELDTLRPMVKRRSSHEPLQYITGSTDFLSCVIDVEPGVLIPRPETEQLVELLLNHFGDESQHSLLDIGTGSGCIPVAIKKERSGWDCTGVDISEKALEVARKNASNNGVEVNFYRADVTSWESNLLAGAEADIIISNPPYITDAEKPEMDPQVLNYEPEEALFHRDPVAIYTEIIRLARNKEASLFLELNDKLARRVLAVAERYFSHPTLINDYDQKERFLVAIS
jgi:release factor glutamine methyltransferase